MKQMKRSWDVLLLREDQYHGDPWWLDEYERCPGNPWRFICSCGGNLFTMHHCELLDYDAIDTGAIMFEKHSEDLRLVSPSGPLRAVCKDCGQRCLIPIEAMARCILEEEEDSEVPIPDVLLAIILEKVPQWYKPPPGSNSRRRRQQRTRRPRTLVDRSEEDAL